MTVYRLYKNRAFEPEAISVLTCAYADVCRTLGVSERDDPGADKVAKAVIEYAQRGVGDPAGLRDRVLQALRPQATPRPGNAPTPSNNLSSNTL
jgi:hypothetical protein